MISPPRLRLIEQIKLTLMSSATLAGVRDRPDLLPLSVFACISCLAFGITDPHANQLSRADRSDGTAITMGGTAAERAPTETSRLDVGDKLKITIYGRNELSGEYMIDDDGRVRIPTLGSFEVAGRTPNEFELHVVSALEQAQQRKGDVAVQIMERRPVYVTGLVAKAGVYPFVTGMTVLHAVTVAGGSSESGITSWLPAEAVREAARIKTSQEELKRLLANKARLTAEREGRATVDVPDELVRLAGRAAAERLIAQAQNILDRQEATLARDRQSFRTAMQESQNELSAFNKELDKINEQRRLREAWADQIQQLSKRGLTSTQRVFDSQILLASADRDAHAAIAAVARGQRTLERAQRDLDMLALDRNLSIQKELQGIDEKLATLNENISASEQIIAKISRIPAAIIALDRTPELEYEVMRRSADGMASFVSVYETTPLRPGDVLRVKANKPNFPG